MDKKLYEHMAKKTFKAKHRLILKHLNEGRSLGWISKKTRMSPPLISHYVNKKNGLITLGLVKREISKKGNLRSYELTKTGKEIYNIIGGK